MKYTITAEEAISIIQKMLSLGNGDDITLKEWSVFEKDSDLWICNSESKKYQKIAQNEITPNVPERIAKIIAQ